MGDAREPALAGNGDATLPAIDRRHDLDALRAIAMLLGIVLHAALSFAPIPWTVKDNQQSGFYYVLFASIHGFRMPLFFMLSGFFTAMLWRKRGLGGLVKQRLKRIALPLFLGCLTIVPAMWAVIFFFSRPSPAQSANPNVWAAVVDGQTDQVRAAIESSEIGVNAVNQDGASLLTVAVFLGQTDMVEMLLDMGADVHQRNRDGGTALHSAAFVGRGEEAAMLLRAGAVTDAVDANGQTARDLLNIDFGTTNAIATSFGLSLDERAVKVGRADIAKQMGVTAPSAQDHNASKNPTWEAIKPLLFQFPVFMHLWFLCWLIAAFAIYAVFAKWLRIDKLPKWLVCSPANLLWLIPLTMLPQSLMTPSTFGPDSSIGLLPIPNVLAYYAVFFFFGVLYWDMDDTHGRLGRGWMIHLSIAIIVVFPIGLDLVSGALGVVPKLRDPTLNRLAAGFLQALYAWLMTFGLIGACRRLMPEENRTLRYISDSSYWLYLAHLPLVLLAQWFVRDSTAPAFVKFVGITVVVSALLLLTYEYGVRYTIIGRILNGSRQRSPSRIATNA
ncbi:acyltransferase family protein [Roseiconus nitratireducens]|uniref:Acyltransferase family protein n=1 Tax=Roseiconus nitratireducens TaxID=2605748 RepID=A0A5M6DDN6_9BACT|nr:acyltransferase family protein [Roseiconus nitratireducens]KAA5545503.1 acyltransferase family protein [Roseiconus nitratireducens]